VSSRCKYFMLSLVAILVFFATLLAFTLWCLRELGEREPLSWGSVEIVALYTTVFILATIILLIAVAVLLILSSLSNSKFKY